MEKYLLGVFFIFFPTFWNNSEDTKTTELQNNVTIQ